MMGTKRIRADAVPDRAVAGRGKPLEVSGRGDASEVLQTSTADNWSGLVIDGCMLRSLGFGAPGLTGGSVGVAERFMVTSTLPA